MQCDHLKDTHLLFQKVGKGNTENIVLFPTVNKGSNTEDGGKQKNKNHSFKEKATMIPHNFITSINGLVNDLLAQESLSNEYSQLRRPV